MDDGGGPPSPGDGGNGGTGGGSTNGYPCFSFDTNSLWLEIVSASSDLSCLNLNLHNGTNQVYAIWGTTSLNPPSVWQVMTEVWPTNTNCMPFTVQTFNQGTLFLQAEDWTGVAEGTNTVPDYWLFENFGASFASLSDSTIDAAGINTLLTDYQYGIDPNIVNFSFSVTNEYANNANVPVQLNINSGMPYYAAILVDDTNFADAVWQPYVSSNLVVNIGSAEGWHGVWIGLRGLPSDAHQTWQFQRLKLDLTPPLLVVTNPAVGTVSVPLIQLQGFSTVALSAISYDISNAAGMATNRQILVSDSSYDTNTFEFTAAAFQGYDIPLAVGLNIITLHATDLAGNTTTLSTNITLDYSSRTNPPAINLYWPQNGTLIGNSNYTWRGWVDDPTATVTAQLVDMNGNTNVYSANVERNGNFWVRNLPMTGGTNWLTLTVTDSASNVAVTNITVSSAAILLTINPPSSDQLWNPAITVTGTISDASDYTVWVNGVKAAFTGGGAWTATNVFLPVGGTAVIQARAIPNTDNGGNGTGGSGGGSATYANLGNPQSPLALDAECQINRSERLFVQSYTDTGSSTTAITDTYEDANYNPGTQDTDTVTGTLGGSWQDGAGGSSAWNWQDFIDNGGAQATNTAWYDAVYEPTLYPFIADASVSASDDDLSDPFNLTLEHCDLGTPVVDQTGSYTEPLSVGTGYLHETETQTQVRHAQAQVKYHTAATGSFGEQSVYIISLSATQIIPSKWPIPLWASPEPQIYASVPYEDIAIGTLGHLDTNGNLYVILPPDSLEDLTPRVDGKSYYTYGPPNVQKYTLEHQTRATALGNTNNARTTIGVGERVDLRGMPSITHWTLLGGGLLNTNAGPSVSLIAPANKATVELTAQVEETATVRMTFDVVEPSGIDHAIITNDYPFRYANGFAGAAMDVAVYFAPTTVSFGWVFILEDTCPASNVTGYFTNAAHLPLDHGADEGAGTWIMLGDDNEATDTDASQQYAPPWTSGGYDWVIPLKWQVLDSSVTNNFAQPCTESFRILDENGTFSIQKFGQTVTRTTNNVITP